MSQCSSIAEYGGAIAHIDSELMRLQQFLQEIGFLAPTSIPLFYNQAAAYVASNPNFHERIKPIEVDFHFIQDKILIEDISTSFV